MLHPIGFSIAEEKIVKSIPLKTKLLSNLIPGNLSTYIYNDESSYYNEYQQSMFAITTKKGGWDCLRHYEILANGCIPYFVNIEHCPPNTMTMLPKQLLIEGKLLYDSLKHKSINDLTPDDKNTYNSLLTKLLEHTRLHLTTRQMAKYILDKCNKNPTRILFLSGDTNPDYLRCLTLHGFKELFGTNCYDYPKVPHIYKSNIDYASLYGKGITYTNLLDSNLHIDNPDITNKYDIVIYGSYHRGMPYYDILSKIYKPDEIILLCGEDLHHCNHSLINKGHTMFVREL